MEIALYVFAGIGVLSIIGLLFYFVKAVNDNSEGVEGCRGYLRHLDDRMGRHSERLSDLADRLSELEEVFTTSVSDFLASGVKKK